MVAPFYELYFELEPIERDESLDVIKQRLERCLNEHKARFSYEPHFEVYLCWGDRVDQSKLVRTEYFDMTDRIEHPERYENLPSLF